jgi:hypothetical protein
MSPFMVFKNLLHFKTKILI